MSTPTMNHDSHMQQQQQQQINEIPPGHSNSANSPPQTTLTRSDSTSTVILEEEETRTCRRSGSTTTPRPSLLAQLSAQLRSLLKTSGLFNKDLESSDRLNELFAGENEFVLQRLLSEIHPNDVNLGLDDLIQLDSTKLLDSRTLSEFFRSESFDHLLASTTANTDNLVNPPPAISSSSTSFSELQPVPSQLKMETNYPYELPTSTTFQGTLNAIEHDHAFLTKRTPATDAPSTSKTTSKRNPTRGSRRTSSRIQSRAICSTTSVESKNKRVRPASRAVDIQTSDDLSYYLERRRKNNEASKVSRAARKQKFGDMDQQCEEYERVNADLRMKISTLEKVTGTLKSGLVNNFQRRT